MAGRKWVRFAAAITFGLLIIAGSASPALSMPYLQATDTPVPTSTRFAVATGQGLCTGTPEATKTSMFPTVLFDTVEFNTPLPPICLTPGGPFPEYCNTATPGTPTATVTPIVTATGTATPGYESCISTTQTALPSPTASTTYVDYDDCDFDWTVAGSWSECQSHTGSYANTLTYSSTAYTSGTYVESSFSGIGVKVYANKYFNRGKMDVVVDGVTICDGVDLYSGSQLFNQLICTSGVLSDTTHTIRLYQRGVKNGASSGYMATVDRIAVNQWFPAATSTPWAQNGIDCVQTGAPCTEWGSTGVRYVGDGSHTNLYWTDALSPGAYYYVTVVATGGQSVYTSAPFDPHFSNSGGTTLYDFPGHSCGAGCYAIDDGTYSFYVPNDSQDQFGFTAAAYGAVWTSAATVYVSTVACIEAATPTAAPTGTPGGSSCVIASEAQPMAWINPPSVELGDCYTLVPAVEIDIPTVAEAVLTLPDVVGVPGVELCVDYLRTTIELAGIDFVAVVSWMVTFVCIILVYREFHS